MLSLLVPWVRLSASEHFDGHPAPGVPHPRLPGLWVGLRNESPQRLNSLLKKPTSAPSGAEGLTEKRDVIAALKALRHPKTSFSAN